MTSKIARVHLIFKTHLDIGFTDFSAKVTELYFTRDIPKAMATAQTLREKGGADRFVWTTGSWLIYEYLEQVGSKDRKRMEDAIQHGDIVWHGLPFTTHTELMDASLFRFGLSLSQSLDKRFGKKTIAAKMTDVPGHTRAIVPMLAEAGIEFLHIGVNPASTPPDVPPVFVWQNGKASIIVMYHRGSYGDLMLTPGLQEAIAFAHTGDNLGPQSPAAVTEIFQHMRAEFPGSEVTASTLDAYAVALRAVKTKLPVIIGEMGDSWIHGAGTDPYKVARYRELVRLRTGWLEQGKVKPDDARFVAFSRKLIQVPEHTWGLDIKTHLGEFQNNEAERFQAARSQPNYKKVEASWQEQRAYIDQALEALGTSPLGKEASSHLAALTPRMPDLKGFKKLTKPDSILRTMHFEMQLDGNRGGIGYLKNLATGRVWASGKQGLGHFRYDLYSQDDYNRFWKQYIINKDRADVCAWAVFDFTKPWIESPRRTWEPRVTAVLHRRDKGADRFVMLMACPPDATEPYGCPASLALEITAPDAAPELHFELQWFKKNACRFPEGLWFSFMPKVTEPAGWTLHKMGESISPLDVVPNGNKKLHGISDGVAYADDSGGLLIESLDAPLVSPGSPTLLDFNNRQPALNGGMHFNLFNNVWGTNFTMWYSDDARFRFRVKFEG